MNNKMNFLNSQIYKKIICIIKYYKNLKRARFTMPVFFIIN